MDVKFKYELDAKVQTHEGTGRITMQGRTETGIQYLIALEGNQGKTWRTESELDKENEKPKEVKGAKVALIIGFLFAMVLCLMPTDARAQASIYETKQDLSHSTNRYEVIFPGQPENQIVLKSLETSVDHGTNETWIISGTLPMTVLYSLNNTQLIVYSNSFLITNQWAILQAPGSNTCYVVNLLYTNQLTNVFIGGPGPVHAYQGGSTVVPTNWVLWACTNRSREWLPMGITKFDGPALHSAQLRAPLAILGSQVSGPVSLTAAATTTNEIRRATIERFKPQ